MPNGSSMAKLRILRKSKKKKSADSPEGDADGAGRDASTRNSGYDNGDSPDLIPATPAPPHPVVMSSSHPSTAEAPSWDSSAEDFGQKVDLTVRGRKLILSKSRYSIDFYTLLGLAIVADHRLFHSPHQYVRHFWTGAHPGDFTQLSRGSVHPERADSECR